MKAVDNIEDNFIVFTVILPICLHLDDRTFHLPYKNGKLIEITTNNFFSNNYTSGSAKNIEADSDTFSHYRFSKLTMKIPHFDTEVVDLDEIERDYENIFLKYYNRFIDSYRLISSRHKIRNIWNFSEFLSPLDVTASKNINPEEFHCIEFGPGKDYLVLRKPLRSEKEHLDLEKSLSQELPLTTQFLMDAKRALQFLDLIHCNINAVIALEISVSSYIKKHATKKGIKEKEIENYLKEIGITGNIKTTLKLITPGDIILPKKNVFNNCKGAITNRNSIVHKGLRELNINILSQQLEAIEELIIFCDKTVFN